MNDIIWLTGNKKVITIEFDDGLENFDDIYFSILENLLENNISCTISDGGRTNIISNDEMHSCPV